MSIKKNKNSGIQNEFTLNSKSIFPFKTTIGSFRKARLTFIFFLFLKASNQILKTDEMKTKSTFRDSSFFLSFFVLVFTGFATLAGPGDPKHPELLSNPVISPSSLNSGDDVIISSTP